MDYPKNRESYFAHRFIRLMGRICLAQEIGANTCYLLTQIVMLEDTKRYSGPVTFYNHQLMAVCGVGSKKTLSLMKRKAVDSGWLKYNEGGKGVAGEYWVSIPDEFESIEDKNFDDSDVLGGQKVNGKSKGVNFTGVKSEHKGGRQVYDKGVDKGVAFIPNPKPSPNPKDIRASDDADHLDEGLIEFCVWWNSLRANSLVPCGVNEDEPSQAVQKAWKRAQKSKDVRLLVTQRDAIERELRASDFARKGGWLRPEKLLGGKNREGEFIVRKLLEGGYRDSFDSASEPPAKVIDQKPTDFYPEL